MAFLSAAAPSARAALPSVLSARFAPLLPAQVALCAVSACVYASASASDGLTLRHLVNARAQAFSAEGA
ncbi:hypothetical protein QS306_00910 [Paraburkholderia bonniea]|uniref:hypothetical protein n=1 Tax=Paraburkholderia bonniea TaxID=2152891 RepID=UPI00129114D9|nr:hypothetical protein [Paraburkholderia bonniea]WJF90282.1 hypothetical protein QS306_00910 [Paraburkholderia bonniea]WJF93597.1 hypothetical protein QS308_00910 [Paraburkholderia bonniea]